MGPAREEPGDARLKTKREGCPVRLPVPVLTSCEGTLTLRAPPGTSHTAGTDRLSRLLLEGDGRVASWSTAASAHAVAVQAGRTARGRTGRRTWRGPRHSDQMPGGRRVSNKPRRSTSRCSISSPMVKPATAGSSRHLVLDLCHSRRACGWTPGLLAMTKIEASAGRLRIVPLHMYKTAYSRVLREHPLGVQDILAHAVKVSRLQSTNPLSSEWPGAEQTGV